MIAMRSTIIAALVAAALLLANVAQAQSIRQPSTGGAIPANTVYNYPADSSALPEHTVDLVRWLMDDCDGPSRDCSAGASTRGPGFTLIEVQAGANREVPSDPADLDSLASATAWKGDGSALGAGDWAVVESGDSYDIDGDLNTNHWQLYIEYGSATTWNFMLVPYEDFSTGGGAASPPAFPATAVGQGAALDTFTTIAAAAKLLITADAGTVYLLRDDTSGVMDHMYVGETETVQRKGGTPPDDRPYVYLWKEDYVYAATTPTYWSRISPLDDSTVCTCFWTSTMYLWAPSQHVNKADVDQLLGIDPLVDLGVFCSTAGDTHYVGELKFLRQSTPENVLGGTRGTMRAGTWVYFTSKANQPVFAMPWDGTAYP